MFIQKEYHRLVKQRCSELTNLAIVVDSEQMIAALSDVILVLL